MLLTDLILMMSYYHETRADAQLSIDSGLEKPVESHSNIRQVIESQNAAGYIVNSHYYDTIIDLYEWGIPLLEQTNHHWKYANDQMWKILQERDRWYSIVYRIGHQRGSYSDNSACYRDIDY